MSARSQACLLLPFEMVSSSIGSNWGPKEPRFEPPTPVLSIQSFLHQRSHRCLIYIYKENIWFVVQQGLFNPIFSSSYLFQQQSEQQIFFGQTNKLSLETDTVVLDILTPALRGVENNWCEIRAEESRFVGPLISLQGSACVDMEPPFFCVLLHWRKWWQKKKKKKSLRCCDYLCEGWELSCSVGAADSGSFIWDSLWPLASWH